MRINPGLKEIKTAVAVVGHNKGHDQLHVDAHVYVPLCCTASQHKKHFQKIDRTIPKLSSIASTGYVEVKH